MSQYIIVGNTRYFCEKTIDCYENLLRLDKQLHEEKERKSRDDAIYDDFELSFKEGRLAKDLLKEKMSMIVFASFTIESYINGYAIYSLGNKYFEDHLEKINIKNKWIVFPKLICGSDFPKDKKSWNLLDKLIDNRNKLAHDKPKRIKVDEIDSLKRNTKVKHISPSEIIDAFYELQKDLISIDESISEYLMIDGYNNKRIEKLKKSS